MASAWPPEEFVCPVCLEVLKDPATLPCGHSYCLLCIQKHWDKGASKNIYSCPQCRQTFKPRPALSRSTVLVEAMEKIRASSQKIQRPSSPVYVTVLPSLPASNGDAPAPANLYPELPTLSLKLCSDHQQPLEFYCRDDRSVVCEECSLYGHKGHQVVRPDEERREKQRELLQVQSGVLKRIQDTYRATQELPEALLSYKAAVEGFQKDVVPAFAELARSLERMGCEVSELLRAHESSSQSRSEGYVSRLQQEVAELRRKDAELRSLFSTQDDVTFLEALLTLDITTLAGRGEAGYPRFEAVASEVRTELDLLRDGLQGLCKASLANIFRTVNDATLSLPSGERSMAGPAPTDPPPLPARPAAMIRSATLPSPAQISPPSVPDHAAALTRSVTLPGQDVTVSYLSFPEPKSREEMVKFRFEPTFDPNTAYRHIRISDGDRKATLRVENMNYPEHQDRFLYWRQVLCKESIAGSPYYWEVEWTGPKVTIGVAYRELGRQGSDDEARLGYNANSWGLYWSGTAFSLWHAGKETPLTGPKARRIGIYLDHQAGLLAFYRVSHGQARLIHSLKSAFNRPLFPGFRFWTGVGATVTICEQD
ncbi:finTRIM family, member 86 [Denticeps clupeoides]|uniref:Tripartite motif-containing protein 16 n=1 Tax=Denticeps clupeoides TaxID=299321 RepID=A0AAY4C8W1_9TELE|nr:tripartite motif-containing protein 16-like [Denticeps clupeoides]